MNRLLYFLIGASFLIFPSVPSFAEDSLNLKAVFEQATQAFADGNYQEAIKLYEKTLEIHPNFAPSYNYLGLCHRAIGSDMTEAKYLFRKAVEIDPKYALAYDNLLKAYYDEGDFDKAIQYGLKAIEIDPALYTVRLKLAWIYLLGKSDAPSAIKHFERASQDAKTPNAIFGLGLAYFMNSQRTDVLDVVTQLRQTGQDQYAEHLEEMLRRGYYVPPEIDGMPVILPSKKKEPADDRAYFDNSEKDMGDMTVHLNTGAPAPQLDREGNVIKKEINIKPQDRIRQLQQKELPPGYSY